MRNSGTNIFDRLIKMISDRVGRNSQLLRDFFMGKSIDFTECKDLSLLFGKAIQTGIEEMLMMFRIDRLFDWLCTHLSLRVCGCGSGKKHKFSVFHIMGSLFKMIKSQIPAHLIDVSIHILDVI